jgi:DNA-directed RNA polymerase alpha subunit
MELELKLPKGNALPLGNALRQMAMSRLPAWRPVAFSLNRKINILHATSDIVEDSTTIQSNLSEFKFIPKIPLTGVFLKERFTFNRALRAADMKSDYFNIVGGDFNLITSLDDREVALTVIYRFGYGSLSVMENSEFLASNMEKVDDYVTITSRHTNVNNFSFNVVDSSLQEEKLVIVIESDTADEVEILQDSLKCLKDSVVSLESMIKEKHPDNYFERVAPNAIRRG